MVLLGSIASAKYVDVLTEVFGARLRFPIDFVGRGDMSRGGLLLRCARSGEELPYVPVQGAVRHGPRPPKLTPIKGILRDGRKIPASGSAKVRVGRKDVQLTNLDKLFWPELGITKGDLIQYYADVAPLLLPHIRDRAMVMKRYPHGAAGEFFFMKRAPSPRPDWIRTCRIDHDSGNVIDFPIDRRPAVAAVGHQSRLHRPEPVVRDV